VFQRVLAKDPVSDEQRKRLEDHLFWYAVEQALRYELPVKLHTGYYVVTTTCRWSAWRPIRHSGRPVPPVAGHAMVFMHIAYPYWQELLAVAKHYANAHIDMCWPGSSTGELDALP